jgi:hypothetical protein
MGFKEIYLVGIDWSGINPEREMSHFDGEVWTDLPANQFRAGYVSAKKYADSHGIKIYNASRGGDLELYERVDLDVTLSKNYN